MDRHTFERDGRTLGLDVFTPAPAPRAAVVFFHGGGWRAGVPEQFHPQCERLAAAGILAASAAYRLDSTVLDASLDARAATERFAGLAGEGVPLLVGGGSAGGHLAACLAACPAVRPSVRLRGAVLFNPVLDFVETAALMGGRGVEPGIEPAQLSPLHADLAGLPPSVVFHGTADALVPIDQARRFRDAAARAGAEVTLHEYEGRQHAFFNPVPPERSGDLNAGDFESTVATALGFVLAAVEPAR